MELTRADIARLREETLRTNDTVEGGIRSLRDEWADVHKEALNADEIEYYATRLTQTLNVMLNQSKGLRERLSEFLDPDLWARTFDDVRENTWRETPE